MSIHLQHDMDTLHRYLLRMCSMVEDIVRQAVSGLTTPSLELAQSLQDRDD